MKLFTASQLRRADELAVAAGIPLLVLMEAAGRAVAKASLTFEFETVLILCGPGNNGGDGYVAARTLTLWGKKVSVSELGQPKNDTVKAARAAFESVGQAQTLTLEALEKTLKHSDLIIDALFGTGLSRAIEGDLAQIVEAVNSSEIPILSVDIPSGLSADTFEPLGPHIEATHTLQLAGPVRSSVFPPAAENFGTWEVADIGFPPEVLDECSALELLDDETVRAYLPTRGMSSHKYSVGTVLIVAGSKQYLGAAELACRGAHRAGAGLVTLAAESRLSVSWPETIFVGLEWSAQPLETLGAINAKRAEARVIGPGLDEAATPYLPDLIAHSNAPTVLDAGALQRSEGWDKVVREHGRCILTPHVGEAARLLATSAQDVVAAPTEMAQEISKTLNAIVVLKGAATVIASADGRTAVSSRGHSGMAAGGAGDVLSGMLGAFAASCAADGPEHAKILFERVAAGVYMHGAAGEHAAAQHGYGLIASDIAEHLGAVWRAFT